MTGSLAIDFAFSIRSARTSICIQAEASARVLTHAYTRGELVNTGVRAHTRTNRCVHRGLRARAHPLSPAFCLSLLNRQVGNKGSEPRVTRQRTLQRKGDFSIQQQPVPATTAYNPVDPAKLRVHAIRGTIYHAIACLYGTMRIPLANAPFSFLLVLTYFIVIPSSRFSRFSY